MEDQREERPLCDQCGEAMVDGFGNTIMVEVRDEQHWRPLGRVHRRCVDAFQAELERRAAV